MWRDEYDLSPIQTITLWAVIFIIFLLTRLPGKMNQKVTRKELREHWTQNASKQEDVPVSSLPSGYIGVVGESVKSTTTGVVCESLVASWQISVTSCSNCGGPRFANATTKRSKHLKGYHFDRPDHTEKDKEATGMKNKHHGRDDQMITIINKNETDARYRIC